MPSRNYETGGVKYLAYSEHRIDIIPTFPSYSPFYTGWYGGGFPPQVIELQCETTFEVAEGIVKAFTCAATPAGELQSVQACSAGRRTG